MRETLIRSLSGAAYVILLSVAVFYSSLTFYILFGIFLLLVVREFCALVKLNEIAPLLVALAIYLYFAINPPDRTISLILLIATLLVSVYGIYYLFTDKVSLDITHNKLIFLIGYIILPFVIITCLPFSKDQYQPEIIFSIFVLVWVNDTFAFLVGKSMGRTKLMERVSPKKTIEGFLGGVLFAIIAALIIAYLYRPEPWYVWISISLVMSIIGTTGDLIESKFKRYAGVKDSGAIMPGHGGILDRLDSVIFAAPFVFLLFQILQYVS